jgi:hypothetical protein
MRSGVLVAAVIVLSLAVGGCVSSEVTPLGPMLPRRPGGCRVQVFPTVPPYPYVNIAAVTARCHHGAGRSACLDLLDFKTCDVGGDTLYGLSEIQVGSHTQISATIAYRALPGDTTVAAPPVAAPAAAPPPPAVPPPPPPPEPVAPGACEPICSPGFACEGGKCIPQCNPPCEAGEICSRRRLCEPAPAPQP